MLIDHFPLLGLRLTTPRLELRLPGPEELAMLAEVAAAGVHDPDYMPFVMPWTRAPKLELCREVIQAYWESLGRWQPKNWRLPLTVFLDGAPIGTQSIRAEDFGVSRRVDSGSWLGLAHHGKGIGTEMRAAALDLAFAGLGAVEAVSTSFQDNTASPGVSLKLGYQPNGLFRRAVEGAARVDQSMLLTREAWERHRTVEVTVEGLQPCLEMFGVPEA